ncbi:MAG: hypothetical protein ACJ76I_05650 [Gaiellaceae bacterium]
MDEYARIIADARRMVARGAEPNQVAFERRIRAVGGDREVEALRQLAGVVAVHRARARLAAVTEPAKPAPGARARPLRTRPTISGSLDIRREREFVLAWRAEREVASWEVRIAERPDIRSDYAVREERELPGDATELELPLGELPMRVHVVGRGRGGRLVRRAILTGVTRETWNDRWQRR